MKPASIMVWGAVSKTWRSLLIFIDQSAKINAKYLVLCLKHLGANVEIC